MSCENKCVDLGGWTGSTGLEWSEDGSLDLGGSTGGKIDDHKRREYPNGTVKIAYNDESQDSRYSNVRI
ncbi:hypothetical protein DMENIID0001_053590 [Sergentomyia squamirostris]